MDEKEMQNGLMMYQLLQNQLEELKKQGMTIQTRMSEIDSTMAALEEIGTLKGNKEILVPLGSGIFVTGRALKDAELLADLGAGILAKKSHSNAKSILEKKKKEIEGMAEKLQKEMTGTMEKMNQLGEQLQAAMAKGKK